MQKPDKRKFHLFPRNLGEVLHSATKPMMDDRSALLATLVKHWPTMLSPEHQGKLWIKDVRFAGRELRDGTLYVEAESYLAPEISYHAPVLLEKLAVLLGYRAIERIIVSAV